MREHIISGAILDCDGVVLDTMTRWNRIGVDFLCDCGLEPKADLVERLAVMSLKESPAFLRDEYDVEMSVQEIEAALDARIRSLYTPCPKVKPGVLETLQILRNGGVKIALASTTPRLFIEAGLAAAKLSSYFDGIFSCDDLEIIEGKKSSRIYDMALDFLNLSQDETIVVEDAFYAILTAKKAGYYVVGFEDDEEYRNKSNIISVADVYFENHAALQVWLADCLRVG